MSVEIVIFKDNTEILSTLPFTIHVVKSLMSDNTVESSNEYGALVVLYQNLYEAYALMTEMVEKIGTPGEKAQELNLNTMFQVWDWLVEYMEENSTANVVNTVNGIDSKIGTSGTTGSTTLFGLLGRGMVKSVQSGFVAKNTLLTEQDTEFDNSYYMDFTVSVINTKKSLLIVSSTLNNDDEPAIGRIINNTTVRIYANTGGSSHNYIRRVIWQVIEFY